MKNVQTKVELMVDLVPLDLVYAVHVSYNLLDIYRGCLPINISDSGNFSKHLYDPPFELVSNFL